MYKPVYSGLHRSYAPIYINFRQWTYDDNFLYWWFAFNSSCVPYLIESVHIWPEYFSICFEMNFTKYYWCASAIQIKMELHNGFINISICLLRRTYIRNGISKQASNEVHNFCVNLRYKRNARHCACAMEKGWPGKKKHEPRLFLESFNKTE